MPATLLADLNTATGDGLPEARPYYPLPDNTFVRTIAVIGTTAYFSANGDSAVGQELWKTDGTPQNTALVMDIAPGPDSSQPRDLTVVNGTLYFTANSGTELWTSDGTPGGTIPLAKPVFPSSGFVSHLTAANDSLFFLVVRDDGIVALWTTDGKPAHTKILLEFSLPDTSIVPLSSSLQALSMAGVNGRLYFTAYDPVNGWELWKSDGNTQSTALVMDVYPGAASSRPLSLTNVNGTLSFTADDGIGGRELWKSNGTAAGTARVMDVLPGSGSSNPLALTAVNGMLYFTADDGATGREVWKSNGTAAGTSPLDLTPGSAGSNPSRLIDVNGTLFFVASGPSGTGLYATDGTIGGTSFLSGVYPGFGTPFGSTRPLQDVVAVVGGKLYFAANDGISGTELWASNGTPAGTAPVMDILPGSGSSNPLALTNLNGTLLFSAYTPEIGRELWRSTGTGTALVKDVNTETLSSNAGQFVAYGDSVYFVADQVLWQTDPDSATTTLVMDFSDRTGWTIGPLNVVNDTLYFALSNGHNVTSGTELWKSDGTPGGTSLFFEDVNRRFGHVRGFFDLNGKLAIVNDRIFRRTVSWPIVWGSDGTAAGTAPLPMFADAHSTVPVSVLATSRGVLYLGYDGSLWRTDGTPTGTTLVKVFDSSGGFFPRSPQDLTEFNGTLYFTVHGAGNLAELWKSDGTEAGTVLVTAFDPGAAGSSQLTVVNGSLFFTTYKDGLYGLWKTDGTAAGTVLVKDVAASDLTNVNGTLFFLSHGRLWKSDGTPAGTMMVKDDAIASYLTSVNGVLYFSRYDGTTGFELWKSDGTTASTVLAQDVNPGSLGSGPRNLTNINGVLYFVADDGLHGFEPWVETSRQDNDVDGVSDVVETAGPNGGDGNGDGILDSRQVEVASLPNSFNGSYVTLASPTGTELAGVAAIPNPSPLDSPSGIAFPVGHFAFTVQGLAPGAATSVVIYLPSGVTADTYWQYGPTSGDPTDHWYEFVYDGTTGADFSVPGQITLHFVDGQRGDHDLTANGVIVDPGAPGRRPEVAARIDVKPGDAKDRLNLASQGALPVAILGTKALDAALIDPSSIVFANARPFQYALKDVNCDGRMDLVLHFRVQETMLGDLYRQMVADDINADGKLNSNVQRAAVSLTGLTRSGTAFAGSDALDLFLSGKALRDMLEEMAAAGLI